MPDQACEHVVAHAETLEQGIVLKRPPDAEPRGLGRTDPYEALLIENNVT